MLRDSQSIPVGETERNLEYVLDVQVDFPSKWSAQAAVLCCTGWPQQT